MPPEGIADAALLAAQAPAGGVLPLRDDGVESALLDLGADRPAVARSKLVAVARAFGPRLQLHEGFRLFIQSGELAPIEATTLFARSAFVDTTGPLMAVVRGEAVQDQLESLIAAGCQLEDHTDKWSLTDERRPIAKAWAAMPESLVESARKSGATVVISRQAAKEMLGAADVEDDLVSVELIDRYELFALTPHAGMLESLPTDLHEAISQSPTGTGETVQLTATATSLDELQVIASRLELAAGTGAFDRPLCEQISPRVVGAWIQVPLGLLEFGIDLRTADDWSN